MRRTKEEKEKEVKGRKQKNGKIKQRKGKDLSRNMPGSLSLERCAIVSDILQRRKDFSLFFATLHLCDIALNSVRFLVFSFSRFLLCSLSALSVCLILSCILFITPDTAAEDYALIIGGVGGEKSFYDEFWNATSRMRNLLIEEYDYAPERVTFLFEDSGEVSDLVDGKSTKAGVETAFADLQSRVQSDDRFLLFMVGHATKTAGGLKFNSPGRDISDIECAALIEGIPAERMILIFGFPYSARVVSQVSKEGRIIITACSAREGYMRSGFGNIFVEAFSDNTADADDNGAISLLEAFLYTQSRVKTWYENDGSVQSEHPHLDDNGDGTASRKELPNASDGTLAQSTYLGKRRSALIASVSAEPDLDRPEDEFTETSSEANEPPSQRTVIPYNFVSKADEAQIEELLADAPQAKDYPDNGAVVLWETEVMNVNEDSSYIYSTRRIVKIFNDTGHKFGKVSIPYTRGNDDITIHHARTLTPDGRVVDLDQRSIVKNIPPPSAVEAGLFVDARLMHFSMPEMSDDCIIDYAYSSNNRGHLMQGEFWHQVYFQTSVPVLHYRFTIHAPRKKTVYYQTNGPQSIRGEPTITENRYTRTYTFEMRDVPPLSKEAFMPAIEDLAYSINITSLDSWDKLMEWYGTLIREQDYVTPEIEQKTKALLRGAWSRKEKIKRLYEYVATNIEYVGIELGIWAIKPHSAPEIFKEGYGDCKDKTTLLSTMLSAVGIQSYPVLISAGESSRVIREIPSLSYFNHMILAVEGDDDGQLIWLDATAETCAFGDLPASDQDRWALIVNPDFLMREQKEMDQRRSSKTVENTSNTGEIGEMQEQLYRFAKSPTIEAAANLKNVETRIQVEDDLSVEVTQTLTVTGAFNTKLRSQLKYINPDEQSKFLHEYMELDDRAKLEKVSIPKLNTMEDELKLVLTWRCEDYLFAIGQQYVLELPLVKHPYAALLSEESRTHPVTLGKAITFVDEVTVNLPSLFSVDSTPEDREIHNGVGSIELKYTKSKRKMVMKQTLRFHRPTIPVNDILDLKALVRQASNKGTKRVLLVQR